MVNRLAIRTCILAITASLSLAAHADTGNVDGRNSVSKQAGVAQKIRVATGPAAAQAGGGISDESSSESDVKLQPVLVTATRRKENVKDVPISISVLGGAELDSSTYPDVGEALRRLPGLDTSSSPLLTGNGISLSIRVLQRVHSSYPGRVR